MADRNGYIGRAPGDSAVTVARQTFSPTGVTTNFTFASGYTVGYLDLFLNGAKLIEGVDYTATDTSTGLKTILIGGTFANNTNGQVGLTVEVTDNSASITVAVASKIPVPAGSSFVISDTGKTLLESGDSIKIYCDTANAIDANISILTGVN